MDLKNFNYIHNFFKFNKTTFSQNFKPKDLVILSQKLRLNQLNLLKNKSFKINYKITNNNIHNSHKTAEKKNSKFIYKNKEIKTYILLSSPFIWSFLHFFSSFDILNSFTSNQYLMNFGYLFLYSTTSITVSLHYNLIFYKTYYLVWITLRISNIKECKIC